MEPKTQPSSEPLPQEDAPVYHTISGGPETLQDVQEEKAQEITQSVSEAVPAPIQQEGVQVVQILPEQNTTSQSSPSPVVPSNVNQSTGAWSIFDNNPKLCTFIFIFGCNLILYPFLKPLEVFLTKNGWISYSVFVFTKSIPLVIAILLGIFDFRGKRKEILKTVVYLVMSVVLVGTIILLVGYALCMTIISAISTSAGH